MAGNDTWTINHSELKEVPPFVLHFLRRPLERIKQMPNWQWPTILILWALLLMISGTASGLFTHSIADFFVGLIIFPISGTVMAAITTGFFYYVFHLFLHRDVPFKTLYLLIVLSAIPYLISRIVISVIAPADLVGLVFSSVLLTIGCVENFSLDRRFVTRVIAGLFAVFLLFWIWTQIKSAQYNMRPHMNITPESYDKLQNELKLTE